MQTVLNALYQFNTWKSVYICLFRLALRFFFANRKPALPTADGRFERSGHFGARSLIIKHFSCIMGNVASTVLGS